MAGACEEYSFSFLPVVSRNQSFFTETYLGLERDNVSLVVVKEIEMR